MVLEVFDSPILTKSACSCLLYLIPTATVCGATSQGHVNLSKDACIGNYIISLLTDELYLTKINENTPTCFCSYDLIIFNL